MTDRYAAAKKATKKAYSHHPTHFQDYLVTQLINECEAARKYDWKAEGAARQLDQDAINSCNRAAKSALDLSRLLMAYKSQYGFAVAAAGKRANVHLVKEKGSAELAVALSKLLAELHGQFKAKNVLAKSKLLLI